MKKLLIFVVTFTLLLSTIHLVPSTTARASARTTYYVDSSEGNDSNAGTNVNTPWKSLNKINSFVFQPGDEILLKAGVHGMVYCSHKVQEIAVHRLRLECMEAVQSRT